MRRLLALCLLFVAASLGYAQNSATRGGITGVILDPSGAVIPGAKVTITGAQGSVVTTSGPAGNYTATGLTPGMYKVTIEASGFKTFVSTNNEVVLDHNSSLDAHLLLGSGGDTVEVEGGIVQIDTENTSLNTAISDTFYNAVPVPRAVASAFYIAPGVSSGGGTGASNPSIGGASGLENVYIADGVTITDQAFGGLGVYNVNYGSLGSGINLTFVKEVDVKTAAFEPKYGRGDGGIIEILTKSGGNSYHGAISAYSSPKAFFAGRKQPDTQGFKNVTPASILSTPLYEISAEVGGYVPGLRDKLFFFGAFDPTLRQNYLRASFNSGLYGGGPYTYSTTSSNYAAKVTYLPFSSTLFEVSTYGDPSRRNNNPETLSAVNAPSVASAYQYGTRNTVARVTNTITPRWSWNAAYYYNYSVFKEQPQLNMYQISDRSIAGGTGVFTNYGLGGYYPTKNDNYSFQIESQVRASLLGEHTFSLGYVYDHTNFQNATLRSGANYAIPGQNALGQDLRALYPTIPAAAIGASTNSTFRLFNAANSCTQCPILASAASSSAAAKLAQIDQGRVYLQVYRGTYKGTSVLARARYHVLYGNDNYKMNRFLTVNAGLRWEQQLYGGTLFNYLFNDNWSPRLGVTIDPFGDHKSKVFFNYARYQNVLPLDAAIRQLGNEQDDTSFFYAPQSDASGNAVLDATTKAVIPVLDANHTLNGLPGRTATAAFGRPSFSSSTGEGILPGTRMEYENEYVIGIERQVSAGTVVKVRYTDRRLGRIVEDIGSQSPEGSVVDGNYAGGIANVSKGSDFFLNENEVVYTDAQFRAANGGRSPGQVTKPGTNPLTDYKPAAAGCTYSNDTSAQNGDYFRNFSGTAYPGACITNADDAGALGADGKPDGFAQPIRRYQAFEVEFNRNLTAHWQARVNYRFAKLFGNYEGFFRNDNGQSDPGISSLFDFTSGSLGLLGDQFRPGYLNSDRRHTANMLLSYTVGSDTPVMGRLKGMTVGTWLHATTGAPLSQFQSHPIYGNVGEVPVGGRGTAGFLPTALQLDLHADAPIHFGEKYTVKLAFDGFNVTNSQFVIQRNQNLDTAPGVRNPDFNKVVGTGNGLLQSGWQDPFYARVSAVFQF